jgi:hypothetical protein
MPGKDGWGGRVVSEATDRFAYFEYKEMRDYKRKMGLFSIINSTLLSLSLFHPLSLSSLSPFSLYKLHHVVLFRFVNDKS